jgi:hypothetical protein
MLTGALRHYPFLFLYLLGAFFATVVEFAAASGIDRSYARYYFANDLALQALVLCNILHLASKARHQDPQLLARPQTIAAASAVVLAVSLAITYDTSYVLWMTRVSRNIYFYAAILNMWVWFSLIRTRHRDSVVLAVSAGFGIQMTGAAIGHSLREISRSTVLAGNLIIVLASFCALVVWWRTFRKWKARAA